MDLVENDPQIVELFKRLNRTFYSLSKIERLATEYSPSEYMLVAKLLANQLSLSDEEVEPMMRDPNVPPAMYEWAASQKVSSFQKWLTGSGLFTDYELSRKVHLMFTLNLMSSTLSGFFNRNELSEEYLNQYSQDFPDKDVLIKQLEDTAKYLVRMKLKEKSYWMNKANAFSLFIAVLEARKVAEVDMKKLKSTLESFENQVPADYALAAKEAVNNKRERVLRHGAIQSLIGEVQNQPV